MNRMMKELFKAARECELPEWDWMLLARYFSANQKLKFISEVLMNNFSAIGRAGADPVLKQLENNKTVCTVSMAVNRIGQKKDGKSVTDWFQVEAWGQTAEVLGKYVKKGHQFAVTGRIEIENWTSQKTGKDGTTVKIIATSVTLLEPAPKQEGEPAQTGTATPEQAQEMFA